MKRKSTGKLVITAPGDRDLAMTRVFEAPRRLVWRALTEPALVKRWLGVQGGWTLDVCEIQPKPGTPYRYVWKHESGRLMGMGGTVREAVAPERLVVTENFDEPWYPGEAVVTTILVEAGGRTTLTMTSAYESKEARDGVMGGPATSGVDASFDLLEEVLAGLR
jgi:uncharacterized protein YndB with AHSA1/START domain